MRVPRESESKGGLGRSLETVQWWAKENSGSWPWPWTKAAGKDDMYLLGIQASLVGLGSLARVRTGPNPHGVSGTGK